MNPVNLCRGAAAAAALWALAAAPASAQTPETIGNLSSFSSIGSNEWKIVAQNAQIRVQFYGPAMVRVRYSKNDTWETLSYAVVGQPQATNVKQTEDADALTFTADSLRLRVTKKPVRIELYNAAGQLVNRDEPAFGTTWIGEQITAYKEIQKDERFIGLGEKTGPLNRRGEGYTNWNTDAFGYGAGQDPIYQTTPFYIGLHHGLQYGVFMDNSYKSHFVFGASNERFSSFTAEGGEMDYYLISHSTVAGIVQDYTYLTGRMPMPPLWGLGLQQARYSYYPEAEVRTLAKTFRDKQIPADGIVLDIHYMDKYKIFTWDKDRFPDPKKMISDLKGMGFHTITIHDPGIKVEKGYRGYDEGVAKDIFAKYPDGKYHASSVWPGVCHFPDFTMQKTRDWWRESLKYSYTDYGVDGFWNDMNEPATWGNRFPDLVQFAFEGSKPGTHRRAHNIYGLMMSKASYEAGRTLLNKRPFILTRAGFSGIQRYSAVWTGDNRSEEDHMLAGVRLLNSMGVSGIAYTGMDVGGFTGGPSPSLFGRWVSIGAFSPFFRIHSAINTKEADAWSFGEEIEAVNKNYIRLRYRMLPYLYSAFYEASQTGMPVNRTLAIGYSHDSRTYEGKYQNQFYFGPSLLVCPSESNKDFTRVFLPEQHYYLYDDKVYLAGEHVVESPVKQLPVFVKAGSILPMQSLVMNTAEKPSDTLYVHVYLGGKGSSYTYYEDDGESFDNEKGVYYRRSISYNAAARSVSFGEVQGSGKSKFSQVKLLFHGADPKGKGKASTFAFIDPPPFFDPQGNPPAGPMTSVRTVTMAMPAGKVEVKF
ncbi:glycoside hydrolase family 31 protein [Nostoc sp. NIES-2111]